MFLDCLVSNLGDQVGVDQSQKNARLAEAKLAAGKVALNWLGEFENTRVVGHRLARDSYALTDLLLSQAKVAAEPCISLGLFQAVEILALQVFDDGHLGGMLIRDAADNGRNCGLASNARCTATALAKDQDVTAISPRAHDDGLDHTSGFDRRGQLGQGSFIELPASLIRVLSNQIEIELHDSVRRRRVCRRCDGNGWCGWRSCR